MALDEVTLFIDPSKRLTKSWQFGKPFAKVVKTHEAFNSLWRCRFLENTILPVALNEDGNSLTISDLIARVMDGYECYISSFEPQNFKIPPIYVKCTEGREPGDEKWTEVTNLDQEVRIIRKELKELERRGNIKYSVLL